jgi:hypothetical protein
MRKRNAADGQHHSGRQLLIALQLSGLADGFLDLALRGDADLLEKFAQAGVENIFVHDGFLITGGPDG